MPHVCFFDISVVISAARQNKNIESALIMKSVLERSTCVITQLKLSEHWNKFNAFCTNIQLSCLIKIATFRPMYICIKRKDIQLILNYSVAKKKRSELFFWV